MDESLMITKFEKFLNEIENERLGLTNLKKNLKDLESFLKIYKLLKNNLDKLQVMKKKMDEIGYNTPFASFKSLNRYGHNINNNFEDAELGEIRRHNQIFKNKAFAKKNIFGRVKYAISAHKIALGHLEEYAKIICDNCKKSYNINKFLEQSKTCKCGSKNFEFKINHSGIHRLEIIPYLPLSGNYMILISELSHWGIESFKRILNILKQQRKEVIKTITPIIKYNENGKTITKRVNIDNEYVDNYEEEIMRRFGKKVHIEKLEFHKTKPTIINDKYTCTNLALAYVKHAEDIIKHHEKDIIQKKIKFLNNLKIYDEINYSVKLEKPEFIEVNDLEDWRTNKIHKKLEKLGLMDKHGNLDKKLKKDLKERNNIRTKIFANIAPTLILWDIFKYYLCTSQDRRKRYGSPFPNILRGYIDRKQCKIFQNIHIPVVKILQEKEHILFIDKMDLILYKKFKFEKKIKELHINQGNKINYAALGPAIVFNNSNYSIKEISQAFKVEEKSIKHEINNMKRIKKPNTKRSRDFINLINNKS